MHQVKGYVLGSNSVLPGGCNNIFTWNDILQKIDLNLGLFFYFAKSVKKVKITLKNRVLFDIICLL